MRSIVRGLGSTRGAIWKVGEEFNLKPFGLTALTLAVFAAGADKTSGKPVRIDIVDTPGRRPRPMGTDSRKKICRLK